MTPGPSSSPDSCILFTQVTKNNFRSGIEHPCLGLDQALYQGCLTKASLFMSIAVTLDDVRIQGAWVQAGR